jgi:site-specific DNA recombinase
MRVPRPDTLNAAAGEITHPRRCSITGMDRKEACMHSSPPSTANAPSDINYGAIYVRVSTEDQGKGFSIPTQLEACRKLADRAGYTLPEAHVLIDEGISGTTMDRPGLRHLRDLVNARTIAAVIVYDPDRLSRNLGHQLLLAEEFERASVKLLIVSHPMEQGPEGWLFFQMRGALAEYERAKILERLKRGLVGRAKAGHVSGGSVAFGYHYVKEEHGGRWEIDEDEAAVVRRVFRLCLEGMATRAIARLLTQERVPSKRDRHALFGGHKTAGVGEWNPATVHAMLTYEGYSGRIYYNKQKAAGKTRRVDRPKEEWVEIAIPAIITANEFQAVQNQLAHNKALGQRNRKHEYLLIGARLRCGRCGRAMTGEAPHGRRRYRCSSRSTFMEASRRCQGYLQADDAERRVWQAIEQVLQQPELIAAEVKRQEAHADEQRADIDRELALVQDALTKCEREEQRWAQAYVAEVIDLAELKSYRADIGARRQSLMKQQQELEERLDSIGRAVEHVEALLGYCERVRQRLQTFSPEEKRLALAALNVQVRWTPEEPLQIEGSIPLGEIVPVPLYRDFCLNESETCQECAFPRLVARLEQLRTDIPPAVP